MGSSLSLSHVGHQSAGRTVSRSWTWRAGDEAVVKLMLPVYYIPSSLTANEISTAKVCWEIIEKDISSIYLDKMKSSSFRKAFPTCKDWFSDVFYTRLFDVHPLCTPMFKSASSKGSFINGLLSFLFTCLIDKKGFHQRLLKIAESHCHKGVKAVEYGIIGECMFWALEKVLGSRYDSNAHYCWMKIFSSMLRVIVPVAVAHELASNEAQQNRFFDHNSTFVYAPSTREDTVCPFMTASTKPNSENVPILCTDDLAKCDGIRTASTTNEHENCNDMMQSNCILLDMNGNNVTSGIPEDTPDGVLLGVSMKSVKQFKEAYNSRLTEIQQNNTWAIK